MRDRPAGARDNVFMRGAGAFLSAALVCALLLCWWYRGDAPLSASTRNAMGRALASTADAAAGPLGFSSRTVELHAAFGARDAQEVWLTGVQAPDTRLSVLAVDPPGPEVTVVDAGAGLPQGVRVDIDGTRVGHVSGQVSLATGLPLPETLTLLYAWTVVGNLSVEPAGPFVDLRMGPSVDVTVASKRDDFRLHEAVIVEGPFSARIQRSPREGSYVVRVVARGPAALDARGFGGVLRLASNDPAEPQLDIPLFALGPAPAE